MTEQEKIAARIRALLAKTVENGCTEDEAIAAAAKAAEMLDRYNMTLDEVELRASPFARHREHYDDAVGERLWKVAHAISDMIGCRYWTSPPGHPIAITLFGFEHEVAIARYLLEICRRAMLNGESSINSDYSLLVPARRRAKLLPFLDGMAASLARRIRELKPPQPPGKGLIVVRNQLIAQAMADEGIKTRDGRARPSRTNDTYFDGLRAGQAVSLNAGVAAPSATRRLGSPRHG